MNAAIGYGNLMLRIFFNLIDYFTKLIFMDWTGLAMPLNKKSLNSISWILSLLLFLGNGSVLAQETEAVRVLQAVSYSNGHVNLHLVIPDGQTIAGAELSLADGASFDLLAQQIEIEQWILLDASSGAVNVAAIFQAKIESFAETLSANGHLSLILFGEEAQVFESISDTEALLSLFDTYNPRIDEQSCAFDALAKLFNSENEPNQVRRILLLVGDATPQTKCLTNIYTNINTPVDVIQITNSLDDTFSNIAQGSGGSYFKANVQSLSSRVDELQKLWDQPVYLLSGEAEQNIANGEIIVSLANGQAIHKTVEFEQIILPTVTPTLVPTATATDTATQTPTAIATDTPSTTATNTVVSITETTTSEATEQILVPGTDATATIVSPTATPIDNVSPSVVNSSLLIIGGVSAVLVVVVVMFALLFARNSGKALEMTETFTESTTDSDLERTEMLEDTVENPLEKTEFVSMDEVAQSARSVLVAYLHHEESGKSYEVRSPMTILGRKEGVGIHIDGDRQISREHVRFSLWPDNTVWMTRLTQNPVILNGKPLDKSAQLRSGDTLQLSANLRLRYEEVKHE
jgi:hypothetical protein